jgi:hypothetical protein
MIIAGALLSQAAPAAAQNNYYNPGDAVEKKQEAPAEAGEESKTLTITSIQKCYDQLTRKDALDIQKNYIKPYQECQRRLELKIKKEQWLKDKPATAQDPVPEKPENFFRVQAKNDNAVEDIDPEKKSRFTFKESFPLNQ